MFKKTKVKINYDPETTLAIGNYPMDMGYSSIPEPNIEISNDKWKDNLGKTMCVIDGVYQEFVKPNATILLEAKETKIQQLKINRKNHQYSNIEVDGNIFINTETAQNKFFNRILTATFPIQWRLADMSWLELSAAACDEIKFVIIAKEITAYEKESDFYNQINACSTVAEVKAINLEF